MSYRTYNSLWAEAQEELTAVLVKDQELQGTFHQDQRGDVAHKMRRMYVQYLCVARRLDTCHNLLLHPQKRLLLRRLLDNTICRIVELKQELVLLDLSDIQHCDDIMVELNLTPQDLVVPIPSYVRRERLAILNELAAPPHADSLPRPVATDLPPLPLMSLVCLPPATTAAQQQHQYPLLHLEKVNAKRGESCVRGRRRGRRKRSQWGRKYYPPVTATWHPVMRLQFPSPGKQTGPPPPVNYMAAASLPPPPTIPVHMGLPAAPPWGEPDERKSPERQSADELDTCGTITERNILIDDCLRRAGLEAESEEEVSPLSVSEAVVILQRHERARQGRARADHRRDILARQERERGRGKAQLSVEAAVVRLQAVTRGMLARRLVRRMRHQEELFLGLRPDPSLDRSWGEKLVRVEEARFVTQEQRRRQLEEAEKNIQTRIVYQDGPHLLSSMEDTVREWMFQKKHETGKFPDLPEEEEGGSSAIVGLVPPDDDNLSDDSRSLEKKVVSAGNRIDSERERAREQAKQKKKKEEEEKSICLKPSAFVSVLQSACDQYQEVWVGRVAEDNPEEIPEEDLLEAEQRTKVEVELRRQVDHVMRHEIQRLKEDVEGEKRGAKKKKRVKKGGKKGRKRKEKDLTPDRTTESLFEELVLNGIIKKVGGVWLKDLVGEVSVVGSEVLANTLYPQPALGDIKNILTEYVILPLGVSGVHEGTGVVRSVLVVGPRGCGKSHLVTALAHESGATLMDLTATNIVGRYPGRAGLNMLTHLVMKVGRLLQPTLVLIDAADKMFMKKVPKTDKSDPRRLKKELPRMLKTIGPEDRIVFVGITNAPWNCDVKALSSVYQKIVMVPRPTFSARAALWRHLITTHGAKLTPHLDISGLARISDGFTSGHICTTVRQVVTEQRLAKLDRTPLSATEFVVPLSKIEPIYREEEEALKAWFQRTPMMRKRARHLEEELEAQGLKGKAAKKPDAKKPKGKKGKRKKKKEK